MRTRRILTLGRSRAGWQMIKKNQFIFNRLYAKARTCDDLPWHETEPPPLLVRALDERAVAGRALDVGCGAGTYSLYMASRGYAVTAIDFMPQAIRMLEQGAAEARQSIRAIQADVRSWLADRPFDVVLDVGCLHSLTMKDREAYRRQLLGWLAPGGDFILVHLGRRGWWDAWPFGPSRVPRAQIIELFAPELELQEYVEEELRGLPLLVGGSMLTGRYWFRRPVSG